MIFDFMQCTAHFFFARSITPFPEVLISFLHRGYS